MKIADKCQPKNKPSSALAAACADDMVVVVNQDNPHTLLFSQGMPLTDHDKATANEVRAEMQNARSWLVKPAA